jgi:hypothetical protein
MKSKNSVSLKLDINEERVGDRFQRRSPCIIFKYQRNLIKYFPPLFQISKENILYIIL